MQIEMIYSCLFFVFGAVIGSFLNVCIVRLPQGKSVVLPRSHCVNCKKTIPWYDNIPFISFLMLAGRCRFCKQKISYRYFLVEMITALSFAGFYLYYGLSPVLAPYLFMISCFIVATFVDFEHRIIPDEISVGGMCVGILFSLFIPEMHKVQIEAGGAWPHIVSLGRSLFGVLIGGGSIYAMGLLGDLIFRKESMGGGDVKLMALVGAFLGWKRVLLAFFIAPLFGAVYGIIEKIRTKDSTIAYGPFLVLGTLISLFWGQEVLRWVVRQYGIEM